jgi:CubicO group peptidase (beta-lactamase class C family)
MIDQAAPGSEVTPQDVRAALPEMEKLVVQALKKSGVPGAAIVIVHKDEVVYLKGFGVREMGKDEPIDADTVFLLASVSKPIASTLLALLVSLGMIDWDNRVIDHDPGFRLYDPWVTREVTLRDLLCHRSGLPGHAGDLLEDLGYDRSEVLHRLRYLKPSGGFRSQYAYTNFGFTAAAVAAARAAGKTWEALADDELFRPLEMKASSYRFRDYAAAKNRALLHVRVNGQWVARYARDADAQSPAGGASSTARDLAQWLRLQLGGGKMNGEPLIAASALGETHRPQVITRPPQDPGRDRAGFYGLGWNVNYDDQGRVQLSHSGGFDLGGATAVSLLPSERLGIVVLTNAAPMGIPEAVCASFLDLVLFHDVKKDWFEAYQRAFKELFKPDYGGTIDYFKPPTKKSPPLPSVAYVGAYANAYFGAIEVVEKDGGLLVRMGPKKMTFPLRHWDRDVFLYQPVGEMAAGPSAVTFQVGPKQQAVRVVVENLDVHGQGAFTRAPAKK